MNHNTRPCPYAVIYNEKTDSKPARLNELNGYSVLALNESGRFIWGLCDGSRTFGDILNILKAEIDDVEETVLASDLEEFINHLVETGFIWLSIEPEPLPKSSDLAETVPLLFIGNKRSGTSITSFVINLHPNIFIPFETDVIWLLYQARNGKPDSYKRYQWDDRGGTASTLKLCQYILQSSMYEKKDIRETFFQIHDYLVKNLFGVERSRNGIERVWIGDKKPVQHGDPELRPFIQKHFPDARYIHIVRHPKNVVASMVKAAKEWGDTAPKYWHKSPEEILERWATHEEWVLQAEQTEKIPVHTLRLEDLLADPVKEIYQIFGFLELNIPAGIDQPIRRIIKTGRSNKYESFTLPKVSKRADKIMKLYGYQ